MTEILTGKARILVVDVPEGMTYELDLSLGCIHFHDNKIGYSEPIQLPPGSWTILGRANEITEEQAKGIVDEIKEIGWNGLLYADYEKGGIDFKGDGHKGTYIGYDNPLQSFHSLLTAHGLTDELILIEK